MSHHDFALLSGIFMLGRSTIVNNIPTACTDGVNKKYGEAFVLTLSEQEMNGTVLHENGHVMLRHMPMYRSLFKLDGKRANYACDYVVNGWIVDTDPQGTFARLPKGSLYKAEYSNLTVKEIFDLLGKQEEEEQEQDGEPCEDGAPDEGEGEGSQPGEGSEAGEGDDDGEGEGGQPGKGGQPGEGTGDGGGGFDEHDWEGTEEAEAELGGSEEVSDLVEQAIREGSTLVGKLKGNVNRRVTDMLTPKIDWTVVFQDFMQSISNGRGTASWRQFNRRFLSKPFNMLMPHQYEEAIREVVLAVDTSGSISDSVLAGVIAEMVKIVESVNPETIRILWWDTGVDKEQIIKRDQSSNIQHLAQASGGGGTRMGCVSEYIVAKGLTPDCVVVFTDGYVEGNVNWQTTAPTVFIVDGNTSFRSPTAEGRVIFKN
jgi:predicted metal-dependent peptidase